MKARTWGVVAMAGLAACGGGGGAGDDSSVKAPAFTGARGEVRLMTLDPGHFHAALVQKTGYEQVDPRVHVFAPEGPDVEGHLGRIEGFNSRAENPTAWVEEVYRGDDFLEKMLEQRPGNVVVISGNNARKADYIKRSVEAGLNVLADKPMAIRPDDHAVLEEAYRIAAEEGVLVDSRSGSRSSPSSSASWSRAPRRSPRSPSRASTTSRRSCPGGP